MLHNNTSSPDLPLILSSPAETSQTNYCKCCRLIIVCVVTNYFLFNVYKAQSQFYSCILAINKILLNHCNILYI